MAYSGPYLEGPVDDWFSEADDEARFCFAQPEKLYAAFQMEDVVNKVIVDIGVAGKPAQLRRLSMEDKMEAIEQEVLHKSRQRTSIWHKCHPLEILAGELWRSSASKTLKAAIWSSLRKEADLLAPIAEHFAEDSCKVFAEVPMGRKRIDVLAYREAGWFRSQRVDGVELKNQLTQLQRGLDQMTTFAAYTQRIYLACTPALGAQFLDAHAKARNVKRWDPTILHEKLERAGIGLLLVEDGEVYEEIEADETDLAEEKDEELMEQLTAKRLIAGV